MRSGPRTILSSLILFALLVARGRAGAQPSPGKTEFNLIPFAGGDSDVGIGVGQFSSLARVDPQVKPFRWRVESAAYVTFRHADGQWQSPYQDFFVQLILPNVGLGKAYRLELRPAFTRETTVKYFGLGNASSEPPAGSSRADGEFQRTHPQLSVLLRRQLPAHFSLMIGETLFANWLKVHEGSVLAADLARAETDPALSPLRDAARAHAVSLFELGLFYDSRDNEIVPSRGSFHRLKLRMSPGGSAFLPYLYGQIDLLLQTTVSIIPRYFILAGRIVGDMIFGDPPFYELALYEQTSAVGGLRGVRGVPAQRYYGRIKLLENLEARSEVLPFTFRDKHYVLSVAGFFDAGRVWLGFDEASRAYDGSGLGIKYGVGGGLRLQAGETFVLRADLAYSPDAHPISGYFASGLVFF